MKDYKLTINQVDEQFSARIVDLKIRNKHVITPTRTLNNNNDNNIKEIYVKISSDDLDKTVNEPTKLSSLHNRSYVNSINIFIPEYTDAHISDKQISIMDSCIQPHTDVIISPKWSGVLRNSVNDQGLKFWNLTQKYIEESEKLNNKMIMGLLPLSLPIGTVKELAKKYIDYDIHSFVLDYNSAGAPSKASHVRELQKFLTDYGIYDETLLYSINMRKMHDYDNYKPADDLVTFLEGIDIIGNFHMNARGSPNYINIFNPNSWTYESCNRNGEDYRIIGEYNRMRINRELDEAKRTMNEEKTVMNLISTKKGAKQYMAQKNQKVLSDYLDLDITW